MEGVGSSVPWVLGEEMTGVPDFSEREGGEVQDPWILGEQRVMISDLCILVCGSTLRLRRLGLEKSPFFLAAAALFGL